MQLDSVILITFSKMETKTIWKTKKNKVNFISNFIENLRNEFSETNLRYNITNLHFYCCHTYNFFLNITYCLLIIFHYR